MERVVRSGRLKIDLQATLSAASAGGLTEPVLRPHHPIACAGPLRLEDDGVLRCVHAEAPPDDIRTQSCIDHSVAMLLIELSQEL